MGAVLPDVPPLRGGEPARLQHLADVRGQDLRRRGAQLDDGTSEELVRLVAQGASRVLVRFHDPPGFWIEEEDDLLRLGDGSAIDRLAAGAGKVDLGAGEREGSGHCNRLQDVEVVLGEGARGRVPDREVATNGPLGLERHLHAALQTLQDQQPVQRMAGGLPARVGDERAAVIRRRGAFDQASQTPVVEPLAGHVQAGWAAVGWKPHRLRVGRAKEPPQFA